MSNETTAKIITTVTEKTNKNDFDNLIETLSIIKLWLTIFILIIITIILIKVAKTCQKMYNMHNETIIRRHNRTTPQI